MTNSTSQHPALLVRQNLAVNGGLTTTGTWLDPRGAYFYKGQIRTGGSPPDRNGWRQPTRYSMTATERVGPRGTQTTFRKGGSRDIWRGQDAASNVLTLGSNPAFPAGLRQQAEVKALLRLKDQRVNLAQAFAERKQTAALLGDAASRIGRSYQQFKRGNMRKAVAELGARWRKQPSNWLELQYGWKPLLSDVYGAAEALSRSMPEQWAISVHGTSQQSYAEARDFVESLGISYSAEDRVVHKCFVRLDFLPSNNFLSALTNIGATNPLQLAWELVPYSFVVDWCFGIGDWLSSMDADYGFRFKAGSYSLYSERSRRLHPIDKDGSPFVEGVVNGFRNGWARHVELERYVYSNVPFPRPPSFSNPASLGHMANGLSLLAQAFGRR